MEYAIINFALATSKRDADFTKLTTMNGNLSIQLRHQEGYIQALKSELCNLKVAAEMGPVEVKTNKKGQPYARKKMQKHSCYRI